MEKAVADILAENKRRLAAAAAKFNPVTGEGSVGERKLVRIRDFALPRQWLPVTMLSVPLVDGLVRHGSVGAFIRSVLHAEPTPQRREMVARQFVRLRCRHDFPFWAACFAYIKRKGGGGDVLFRLTRPQRRFVSVLEKDRLAGKPIRVVMLKARQWGGSTTSQLYMAWLQLTHKVGLNSLIIAHQGAASDEIKDMFDRMVSAYPARMLHPVGEDADEGEKKLVPVGKSGSAYRVPQRNFKIKIGTAERPDSCRGGDYSLVHLSEVGIWRATDGKRPEDIVRSACSGVLYEPYTMIVYESTANGTGNFFHREYVAAKAGRSQFSALFVPWFEIDQYSARLGDEESFAREMWRRREGEAAASEREEPGKYIWWLWEKGATLQAIAWYMAERRKYNDHGQMAAEFPSDDIEAFTHSGQRVFDRYLVEKLRPACRPPRLTGEVSADGTEGDAALTGVRLSPDAQGRFWVWGLPEVPQAGEERVTDRYLAVVDIGGRGAKADWSVVLVIDRAPMLDGGKPVVAAQWYGHTDMDILAWKAAQIASLYDNALLVIESNTLETRDRERAVDGDQSHFILNQIRDSYPNLYARRQSEEDIREGLPRKYGFHTNVSTKPLVISTLVKAVRDGLYTERDERCLDEFISYERKQNGAYGAVAGEHDDLLMTRAIGLHVCFSEMPVPRLVTAAHATARRGKAVTEASF